MRQVMRRLITEKTEILDTQERNIKFNFLFKLLNDTLISLLIKVIVIKRVIIKLIYWNKIQKIIT